MSEKQESPLSPTVTKVLDEYLASLKGDEGIDNEVAKQLDTLLRQGKIPKFEDIDEALAEPKGASNS